MGEEYPLLAPQPAPHAALGGPGGMFADWSYPTESTAEGRGFRSCRRRDPAEDFGGGLPSGPAEMPIAAAAAPVDDGDA